MSDFIKHECGIAFIRLRKPLQYYIDKYGTPNYGLNKLYLLMEKQHNRGQDGAGVATVKLNPTPGTPFIDRTRSASQKPIAKVFKNIFDGFYKAEETNSKALQSEEYLKDHVPFAGEVMLGHVRYGTHGKNDVSMCHPFLRSNNWMTRNLVVAGNFNMTNNDQLFNQLVELGQHPRENKDTVTVLEKIGHFLDEEVQSVFDKYNQQGYSNREITNFIAEEIDVHNILSRSAKDFDGGYVMAGLIGNGDAFILRDPSGIRPVHYYMDDEIIVVTSERPAIQTAFNVPAEKVKEFGPGNALIVSRDGDLREVNVLEPRERKSCSFERIYFSRGTDKDIYKERKQLGFQLTERVLKAVDHDWENTVFSFIPNTAEVAFYGMMHGLEQYVNEYKREEIRNNPDMSEERLDHLLKLKPRAEKVAVKDVKLRTFITEDSARDEMVSHVYDISYGTINKGVDNLVVLDDSIVRGTTLEKSILSILDRLGPKKIVVVSSAPQIRFPDCYGIDMSKFKDFIAFRAVIDLVKERGMDDLLRKVYNDCIEMEKRPMEEVENCVNQLYATFTEDEVSAKISEIVKPKHIFSEVEVIFQSVNDLHKAIPNYRGDWYFTGNFPTPGGNRVANRAFINYIEGRDERAY